MGFRPRSSWDPRFAKFFDDWAAKMKEHGWDPTQTTVGGPNGPTGPEAAKLMDGALLSQYIQYARREGKDPLGGLFTSTDGRGSAAGIWLKNRIAALDREEAKKAGGVWERGGSHRSTRTHAAGKRPVYSSDDTFNSPWDAPGMQGSSTETARPWWAAGASPLTYPINLANGSLR
ncbi:hypothetical protein M408DRAFT_265936 [Serendipita vermifera MAFF 305830]|uniref:Uncharacterized protein n=1 Tax=Serendipita vermifera MAFF 305830 TaxID=933852 RepID=A0A0C3AEZ0_SERVB|nr:hypothetical protein M408DRAFT_265936 [Serendipita vermifera MAFF 305830]